MNEHTGFELPLSDYEKGYLTAFYDGVVLPDWAGDAPQDWYGIQIGERMFDLNVWLDEETSQMVCVVYPCAHMGGEWTTDTSESWFLREVNHDGT